MQDLIITAEIVIPIQFCYATPLMVSPYTTPKQYHALNRLIDAGSSLPLPLVRSVGGNFEVLQGWDLIHEFKERGLDTIKVRHANVSDSDAVYYSIVEQSKLLELSWINMARGLYFAKQKLQLNNTQVAAAARIERSKVTRLIKIAHMLSPRFQKMAEQNRLGFSACRRLVTLPTSRQESIAQEALEKVWDESKILMAAFQKRTSYQDKGDNSQARHAPLKSMDIKRQEIHLSELLGRPTTISVSSNAGNGEIELQFFNRKDLVALGNQLLKALENRTSTAGKIVLKYDSLDDFDDYLGRLAAVK